MCSWAVTCEKVDPNGLSRFQAMTVPDWNRLVGNPPKRWFKWDASDRMSSG